MSKLLKNSHLYLQISEDIKEKIKTGVYQEGKKIPTEEMLCEQFNVSRITVRKAIQVLCDEGILVKRHGKGTFVDMPKNIETMSISQSFNGYCIRNGYTPSVKIISQDYTLANREVAAKLGVNIGDKIIKVERLMSIDGIPTVYEIDYFRSNFKFLLDQNLEDNSLLQTLIESNVTNVHAFNQTVYVKQAEEQICSSLGKETDFQFLCVDEVVLGSEQEIIYYNRQYIVYGQYNFTVVTYK